MASRCASTHRQLHLPIVALVLFAPSHPSSSLPCFPFFIFLDRIGFTFALFCFILHFCCSRTLANPTTKFLTSFMQFSLYLQFWFSHSRSSPHQRKWSNRIPTIVAEFLRYLFEDFLIISSTGHFAFLFVFRASCHVSHK